MLNNILNNVENMVELNHELTVSDINEMGFIFTKYSDLIMSCGFMLSAMTIAKFDEILAPVVIIDYNFEDVSRNAQEFLVYHELGHYYKQKETIMQQNGVYRDINDEYEADEYAAEQIGYENAINALNELIVVMDELSGGLNIAGIEEVRDRINNLRSHC